MSVGVAVLAHRHRLMHMLVVAVVVAVRVFVIERFVLVFMKAPPRSAGRSVKKEGAMARCTDQ